MPWRYGVRFLVLLLPCLVAAGLLVAFHAAAAPRPMTAAAVSATPQAPAPPGGLASTPRHAPSMQARGPMAMRHHPVQWARPHPFADRRPLPRPAVHHPVFGLGSLLGAFAITGALTMLIFAIIGSLLPERLSASTASEQELTALRDEVDRLQRERRQLRLALNWHERLLARTGQADGDDGRPELPE